MSTTSIINKLFQLEVAKYIVPGTVSIRLFGERENVVPVTNGSDLWLGTATTIPIPSSSGEQMTLVSSDAQDNLTGTGIQKIQIEYLDGSGLEQIETIDMEGDTPVNTVATDIACVNAIHSVQNGSNGVAVGNITIYKLGASSTIYNRINSGGNMSLNAFYKVPSNKTLFLSNWAGSAGVAGKRVTIRLRSTSRDTVRDKDVVYDGANPVFLFIDSMNLSNSANAVDFSPFVRIPSGAFIKITAWTEATGQGAFVSASAGGYLVTNA